MGFGELGPVTNSAFLPWCAGEIVPLVLGRSDFIKSIKDKNYSRHFNLSICVP